ncbi:hypothetical protein M431DRAFT_493019 [Trichoderma harzianum CBS 226.95]|uniref:Uncharacterized protein n=1 Tax=Trichoderma harzianum CBS 226.95 TaxID=983964 RepID=A0A2T4AHI1_TRIHA|nr:hypothetical protein M431DRAFT_493019 [Trichoderma harzianum CBS 226.95]PTB56550.1 hypothetical protein M431DRAFT_493019 [Trichoderma harzianum CBS 226.95]
MNRRKRKSRRAEEKSAQVICGATAALLHNLAPIGWVQVSKGTAWPITSAAERPGKRRSTYKKSTYELAKACNMEAFSYT